MPAAQSQQTPPLTVPAAAHYCGRWVTDAPKSFRVDDPGTGGSLIELPDVDVSEVDSIMASAEAGFEQLRAMSSRARAQILRRAYELVIEREDQLARLITLEMGKALPDSLGEVRYAAGFLLEYAERATKIEGRHAFNDQNGSRILTQLDPVGVSVLVTPWNFPLAMGTRKVAPAVAIGCSVVIKPAQQTPLAMLEFAGIMLEAGLPAEAISVVTTTDSRNVVAAMVDHKYAAKISFTGSTEVGRRLAAHAAERLLRMSMELGGNAPFVVFDDADLDAAAAGALLAKFRNGGQACTAANRFLVQSSVADQFIDKFAEAAATLKLGYGLDDGTTLGPMIDDKAVASVTELVDDARGRGAQVVVGGPADGRYFPATILKNVPVDARILHEEIFGPVAPVVTFESEQEGIALANATPYGLASYAFTEGASRLLRVSRQLKAGMVGMNTGLVSNPLAPFGGIGDSGFGREGGPEGINEYSNVRYVTIPDPRLFSGLGCSRSLNSLR